MDVIHLTPGEVKEVAKIMRDAAQADCRVRVAVDELDNRFKISIAGSVWSYGWGSRG